MVEMKQEYAVIGIAAIVLLVLAGALLVATAGFFPGLASDSKKTQSDAYWRGEAGNSGGSNYAEPGNNGGGNSYAPTRDYGNGYQMPTVWYYNPFENPANSFLFVIFAIIAPIITAKRLMDSKSWKVIVAASFGALFIACTFVVITGAVQNALSIKPNETSMSSVTVGSYYGWIAFALVLAALGAACLYMAEKWRKENNDPRSVYSVVLHTMGLFLAVYAASTLVYSSLEASYILNNANSGYGNQYAQILFDPMRMWGGWILFSAIAGYFAYRLLSLSQDLAPSHPLSPYALHAPATLSGAILLFAGSCYIEVFLIALINNTWGTLKMAELVFGIAFCAVSFHLFSRVVKSQMKQGVPRTGHYWLLLCGGLIGISSLLFGIYALYLMLAGSYGGNSWQIIGTAIASLIFAGILFYAAKTITSEPYSPTKKTSGIFNFSPQETTAKPPQQSQPLQQKDLAAIIERLDAIEARLSRIEKLKK